MKLFAILFVTVALYKNCKAAPQSLQDDVELVPATNTNERDPETGFPTFGNGGTSGNNVPVIIIRTSSGGKNPLHTLLNDFFGKSGATDEDKVGEESEDIPEIPLSKFPDLSTILGIPNKDSSDDEITTDDSEFFPSFPSIFKKPTTDDTKRCGLLCTLFKNFDTQLKTIEEEVREIRDKEREKENEISQDDQESTAPVNEYTEEVLPDGTIVRTNKTYSTNEDGTSFFSFQSTSFNSFGHSGDKGTDDKTEEKTESGEDGDTVVEEETISDNIPATQEYEDIEEEREELEENVGVDEGLFNA